MKQSLADKGAGITDPVAGQGAAADKLDGKSPLVASKEMETKKNLTEAQSKKITNNKFYHKDIQVIPKSQVPSEYILLGKSPDEPWPDNPGDVYVKYTTNPDQTYAEVNYGAINSMGEQLNMIATIETIK